MRNFKLLLSGFVLFFFLLGCSSPTMEEEAQNAAMLMKKSMEFSALNEFGTAEKNYMEAQKIIEKYRNTDQFMEFYEEYTMHLQNLTESEDYETLFK